MLTSTKSPLSSPILWLTIVLILLSVPVAAKELGGKCQIQFFGSSTLNDFTGIGACHPFTIESTEVEQGKHHLGEIELRVPIEMMNTGNESRDQKMYAMFASKKHPEIIGRIPAGSLEELQRTVHAAADEGWSFPLWLTINGVEREVTAHITQLVDSELAFAVDFKLHLALDAFGMEPPTALWTIKVSNHVLVKIKIQLDALPTPWQP